MWFYVQMWFPLLTIALTAAICFSVVSFIMGRSVRFPTALHCSRKRLFRCHALAFRDKSGLTATQGNLT
jgi:hypothetical protein